MAEAEKVMYIVVVDDGDKTEKGNESFRYTRPVLQSCLQLMGCKPHHTFKSPTPVRLKAARKLSFLSPVTRLNRSRNS
ncbi:hypothetical protein ACFX13_030987 [Malus domestica]